jgi:prolyl-tRNA synthetase
MQRYSKLFGKTQKTTKEYDSKNATLLTKAGFIHQEMAGVYTFLPLGLKVYKKIEQIIREEMDKVANETLMTVFSPKENWETTDRYDSVDVLFKAVPANKASKSKNDAEYVVGCTQEEIVTPLAKDYSFSYKDFPFCVYQFLVKFRNEARPKSGLMRGREFIMKDAYSFHIDEENLLEFYEDMKKVYTKIFDRLGIGDDTVIALASGGDFTEKYSHEYQTIVETGEDTLFKDPESGTIYNQEVTPSQAPKLEDSNEEIKEMKDVEGKDIIGVDELAKFLDIPVEKTTKTLIYKADDDRIIAAAVRGGYDIDEEKLRKVVDTKSLELADEQTVKEVTQAEVGYAGILDLPDEVEVFIDESVINRKNFETGANKTNFHTINVNFGRDLPEPEEVYDIKVAQPGDLSPESGKPYEVLIASEVGNIFPLNTKFSKPFDYKYTDENGKQQDVYMGCYGIGLPRVMGVIAEKFNDGNGLIWPKQVAPFDIHFITLDQKQTSQAEEIIRNLEAQAYSVLWDEREDVSAGEKFADADLIGIPARVILSKRSLENGGVEVTSRKTGESEVVAIERLAEYIETLD